MRSPFHLLITVAIPRSKFVLNVEFDKESIASDYSKESGILDCLA
jgi:hypothetical protein